MASAFGQGVLLLLPLLCLYWAVLANERPYSVYDQFNAISPFYFIGVLLLIAYRVLRAAPATIWSAIFWLPVQSAIFFGFGPLVEVYGNEATKRSLSVHILSITPNELFDANLLSTAGVTLLLCGLYLHIRVRAKLWRATVEHRHAQRTIIVQPETLGYIFVFVGGLLRYGVIYPASWGQIDLTVAGVVSGLGSIVDVGFAILAYTALQGKHTSRATFAVLWPLHVFLCLLTFAKTAIIIAFLLPAIAAYLVHKRVWRLGLSLAGLALVFQLSQPFVVYGRSVIHERSGTINEAGYMERIKIATAYSVEPASSPIVVDERQGWWTRLNFSGVQTFAIQASDDGIHGSSLSRAWMYFVPRAVWPEKPIMVGPGAEFYSLVTGREPTSFLALSVYGDLYWQFGWLGVLIGCPLIGWIFAMMSWRAVTAMQSRNFIMIPAVLVALEISLLGMNKYVVNGIIGPLPIYIAYLFGVNVIHMAIAGNGSYSRRIRTQDHLT
ncbi:MAG: hypothetical protein AAF720_12015 [Pseudomonadota bacterium]